MSMHEIEDITEYSINFLNKYHSDSLSMRDLAWNLYDFEGYYDVGYTKLRVKDVLLKHRFLYSMDLEDHPDYDKHEELLDDDDDFILRHPDQEWDEDDNPEVALYDEDDDKIYFEAGGEFWQRQVELKKLSGADSAEPKRIPFMQLLLIIFEAADAQNEIKLMQEWYAAGPNHFLFMGPPDYEQQNLPEIPELQKIREIAQKHNIVKSFDEANDSIVNQFPTLEHIKDFSDREKSFYYWWYDIQA